MDCKERREQRDFNKPCRGLSGAQPCPVESRKQTLAPSRWGHSAEAPAHPPAKSEGCCSSALERVGDTRKGPRDAGTAGQGCAGSGSQTCSILPRASWEGRPGEQALEQSLVWGAFHEAISGG